MINSTNNYYNRFHPKTIDYPNLVDDIDFFRLGLRKLISENKYQKVYKYTNKYLRSPNFIIKQDKRQLPQDFSSFLMEKLYNEKIIDNKYIFHYNFVECNFISEFKITDFNASKIREELLPLLIDKMARINSIRTNKFGWFDLSKDEFIGTQSSWQDYLKLDLDWHLSELSKYYLFTDCDRKFFIKCLELCNCDDPRLLHGDLNDKNILITDRLKVELIDWETALSGDPIYDLAFLCTFTWAQEYSNHIISLYGQMTYIERPDFSFRFWTYFLRISIAKFLILKQNGITDLSRAIDRIDHSLSQLMSYA